MTAASKDDIFKAALNALSNYPLVAQQVQAGDPRVLAQISAQAAMLAMLAEQVEVAQFEPFMKARDSTVLADAALKGVLPLARAARLTLALTNANASAYIVEAGRRLVDDKGRIYEVEASATAAAGGMGAVTLVQRTQRTIQHTVESVIPFYQVEIDQIDDAVFLNKLEVRKGAELFTYAPDWFNVLPNTSAYQVETDERRRMWVRFGARDVVGYGVQAGDVLDFKISECEGRVSDLMAGAKFNFEYVYSGADGNVTMALTSITDEGANPPTMADMRVMARYPALYDHNAVYLGEFDFLIRRYLSDIRFLSVWNEQIEESARGAHVSHINKLFVSGLVSGMSNNAFQARAKELISRADNSYGVVFVATAMTPVSITVTGKIAVVHDPAIVEAQIRAAILGQFGDGQPGVSKGLSNPIRNQPITRLLRESVPALQDELSDFIVSVTMPETLLPEMFMYVSSASLTVTLSRASHSTGLWNY